MKTQVHSLRLSQPTERPAQSLMAAIAQRDVAARQRMHAFLDGEAGKVQRQ